MRYFCMIALFASLFTLAGEAPQAQAIRIADFSYTDLEFSDEQNQRSANLNEATISAPGASFIKVHFDYFQVPQGYVVEISDPKGQEVYRYGKRERDEFTYDRALGENGRTSFAAMSITGDTAIIRLINMGEKGSWSWTRGNGVIISRYMEGYPNAYIQELTGENLWNDRSTCGVNERRDVKCWESQWPTEYARARSVARLVMSGSLCTAWRVGDGNHMFTNNHCMASASSVSGSESWFNYQNTSCGGSSLDTITKVSGNTMFATNNTLDYTLYSVNSFASIQGFGNLGLDVRAPISQEEIYIPQHGSGNPKELAIESDQNTGNICRIDEASANGNGTGTDAGYYCDTIGGSSGSPVLARSSHKVIALHHFGGCTNQGVLISKIWPQVSTFFGGQIPDGSGGGGGNQSPNAAFSHSVNNLTVSFSDSSSDPDGSIASRSWNFGDGNSSSATNPSHTYASNGSYTVSLTVTDNQGASDSSSAQIQVGGDGVLELDNGTPVTGIALNTGTMKIYKIWVPGDAVNLVFETVCNNGDADLYTRFGAAPTTSTYDCRPYSSSSSETCSVATPSEGWYYVGVRAYSSFTDLSLTASFDTQDPPSGGIDEPNQSASQGQWIYYTITVPAGASRLETSISGGSGDADLYLRFGQQPTTSNYACRPYLNGNNENCNVDNPQAGTWHIGLRAYTTFSGTHLIGEVFD